MQSGVMRMWIWVVDREQEHQARTHARTHAYQKRTPKELTTFFHILAFERYTFLEVVLFFFLCSLGKTVYLCSLDASSSVVPC